MRHHFPVFLNIVLPLFAGVVYFAMAVYVRHIGPLRTLIAGSLTYDGAFWGFLFLGGYLASRPLQILFPHPWPLIINDIREIGLIGVFGPSVFLAVMSLVLGADNIPTKAARIVVCTGMALALLFAAVNIVAIGGAEPFFTIGPWTAFDGLWFKNPDIAQRGLMRVLFLVRLVDPVLLVFAAGTAAMVGAIRYPPEKRMLYDNMPRKLILLGAGCYSFSLSMLAAGLLFVVARIPNQWWVYYAGALAAGILETISLTLPMRRHVQVSDHR
jgi:hypothetical protein